MAKDDGLDKILAGSSNKPEQYHFYNGEVELLYDAPLHAYYVEVEGEKILVPGVTTVIAMVDKSGPLNQWAANTTVQYLREKLALAKLAPIHNSVGRAPWDLQTDGVYVKIDD